VEEVAVEERIFDDIDEVFARAGAVNPPADLLARVMADARSSPAVHRLALLYVTTYLLALAGLALFAYELGAAAVRSGMSALIGVLLGDVTLLAEAPASYIGAILSSIPWAQAAGVLIDLAILAIITRLLLSEAASAAGQRRPAARA
jgi:hypothetical protein